MRWRDIMRFFSLQSAISASKNSHSFSLQDKASVAMLKLNYLELLLLNPKLFFLPRYISTISSMTYLSTSYGRINDLPPSTSYLFMPAASMTSPPRVWPPSDDLYTWPCYLFDLPIREGGIKDLPPSTSYLFMQAASMTSPSSSLTSSFRTTSPPEAKENACYKPAIKSSISR